MKRTGTTEQALLTNHKPEPHVRRPPSESTTLATSFILYCSSFVSFSGWLLIFLACHWNTERHRIGCDQMGQQVCALIRRHTTVYILVLVFLFSCWSVPQRCNGCRKLVRGLAPSPWRVIQCPRDAAQPELAPLVT
uniref:Frizzled/Smoothened transmembrane domain-containing protein n=1 Tax=Mesocestoides corti TaxID=53468 RepID=A0A5K3FAN7_MESCO